MKRLTHRLSALALGLAALTGAMAQEVTLRMQHFLPAQAPIPAHVITPWVKQIETASAGRIKFQVYPAMQMGGTPAQLFDQARDGVVDVSWAVLGYMPGRFVKMDLIELPFLAGLSAEAASKAMWDFANTQAADEFKEVKLLAVHTQGPGLLHTRFPVKTLADLKDQKIRGGTRIINKMLESLGAVPIPVPMPSVGEALSKGVVQGTTMSWEAVPALKVSELATHHTNFAGKTGLYNAGVVVVMNKGTYNKLPADLKKIIDDNSGPVLSAAFGRGMDTYDQLAREATIKKGNSVVTLDEKETQRWKEATARVRQEWVAELKGKGLDGEALIAAFQKLSDQYSH